MNGANGTVNVLGQPCWYFASADVEAYVTEQGGHVGPVTFDTQGRRFQPYAVAPWAEEPIDPSLPSVLQVLRGDFFCLPFGNNDQPHEGSADPPHGETANEKWTWEKLQKDDNAVTLHLSLTMSRRAGRVDKYVTLRDGHLATYSRHVISGMSGPMNLGHHAMIRFPPQSGSGRLSMSPFLYGQVAPDPLEPLHSGRGSMLKPGSVILSLDIVPTVDGGITDLTRFPARQGSEDLVMLISDPNQPFAWTAVAFPDEGLVWFALKNPRVLRQTIVWLSNGGRRYAPWNGRHLGIMGLEEVTSYFHYGFSESVQLNPIAALGDPTFLALRADQPLEVRYIAAVAPIPEGFDRVAKINACEGTAEVCLTSTSGASVKIPLHHGFLYGEGGA